MTRPLVVSAILMGLAGSAAGGAPGVARCASCHHAQALAQPATSMGRALETVADCQILREHPQLDFRQSPYSHKITSNGERSIYTVSDGKATLTTPVAWAFGLGAALALLAAILSFAVQPKKAAATR